MPTWLKVILIIGVLILLLVMGLVGAGVYLWRQNGPQFVAGSQKAITEGNDYGRQTDNQGCLTESVARHQKAEGFGELIKTNLFLRACLEASRPTPAFCDDAPKPLEFMKTVEWQTAQCRRYGLTPQKQCGQLFQQVQQFCVQRQLSGAPEEDTSGTP